MDDVYLQFLRYCLNDDVALPVGVRDIDWMNLMDWAESQAIVGVIYGGITDVRGQREDGKSKLEIPFEDLAEWIGYAQDIEAQNKWVNQQCVEIVAAFRKDGFETCILKGQGNAMMYPNPLLRNPGDIDLWVMPKSNDVAVRKIVRYVRGRNPGGKAGYHHVDYGDFNDVAVEVHYRPSFANNLLVNRRLQKWFRAHGKRLMADLPNGVGKIPVPTWEFNVVFLLSHIYRHVIQSGLGWRQMIDYYFLLKSRKMNQFSVECLVFRELGLLEIAGAVMWVLGYLVYGERFMGHGCRKEEWMICEPDERRGRFLLEEIMQGGNFGTGLKSDHGWLSADTAIGRNLFRLKRDIRLLRYFPSECLWEPLFRLWHFFWRVVH